MDETVVDVVVRVHVAPGAREREATAHAVEMVKDALATRARRWQMSTFVSEGDVNAASPNQSARAAS